MTSQSPLIGRTIAGRFRIVRMIGRGGMAAVFAAVQPNEPRDVAIKIMKRELVRDRTVLKRFRREAKAAATLNHPNTVRVLDFGVDGEDAYIAMELADGKDLLQALAEQRPMDQRRATEIVAQVCDALASAHEKGIIHRDLKPENIMLVPSDEHPYSEQVKVLDFGIAKIVEPPQGAGQNAGDNPATITRSALTRAGTIVGTPAYMSPEQCRGGEVDARSDVYSTGVLLYQLLTGQVPFLGETPLHTAMRHIHAQPKPPHELRPDLASELDELVLKALAKTPAQRQQSAAELGRDLRGLLSVLPKSAAVVRPTDPAREASTDESLAPTEDRNVKAKLGGPLLGQLHYSQAAGADDEDDDEDNIRTRVKAEPFLEKDLHAALALDAPPEGTPTSPDAELERRRRDPKRTTTVMDPPSSGDDDDQPTALKNPEELRRAGRAMAAAPPEPQGTPTALTLDPAMFRGGAPAQPRVGSDPGAGGSARQMDSVSTAMTPVRPHPKPSSRPGEEDLPTGRKGPRVRTVRLNSDDPALSEEQITSPAPPRPGESSSNERLVVSDGVERLVEAAAAPPAGAVAVKPTLRSGNAADLDRQRVALAPTQKVHVSNLPPAQTLKMTPEENARLANRPAPASESGFRGTIERLPGTTGVLLGVGIGVVVSVLFAIVLAFFSR